MIQVKTAPLVRENLAARELTIGSIERRARLQSMAGTLSRRFHILPPRKAAATMSAKTKHAMFTHVMTRQIARQLICIKTGGFPEQHDKCLPAKHEECSMKTDRELQKDVAAELTWDPFVDDTRVGVEVTNGIVTLFGHVDSYAQKWAAERVAERVVGIKDIAVELDVILAGSSQRTDSDISSAATMALDWNASVPKGAVKVMVEDGWLTLSGEVQWAYMRIAAANCVRTLVGVKGVVDKIELRPSTEPHDVKTRIEAALQRRAHFDTKGLTVGVEKGTITLSGVVDSWAERETVEHAAWSAPGVQNVVDNLLVAA